MIMLVVAVAFSNVMLGPNGFIQDWILAIQGVVLLAGLYLGVSRGFMALKDVLPDTNSQIRAMLLPSIFALLAVNLLLKLYLG